MTRAETLLMLVEQAQSNGFDFRPWYEAHIDREWPGRDAAIAILNAECRYFSLIFSHDFAVAFWKRGAHMRFVVPSTTYMRMNGKGEVVTITRKPFTRRTIKADVWKYHLRQVAVSVDPIGYLSRFLPGLEQMPARAAEIEKATA
jgi:hypothetical protein